VALTPPSTEFSIAIMAATLRPVMTSSNASPTFATLRHTAPSASGTWRRASHVNVPTGPR